MLKRKNEEPEESKESTHFPKRVALDADAVEQKDIEDDKTKTSVSLSSTQQPSGQPGDEEGTEEQQQQELENTDDAMDSPSSDAVATTPVAQAPSTGETSLPAVLPVANNGVNAATPSSVPTKGDYSSADASQTASNSNVNGPISSHTVRDEDPSYVHFRMLVSIPDTAAIVGKGGESINKIKEQSNARVNVSENLKNVPERVISVRGSAEYVAKAFGLIVRTINNEPFDVSSNADSESYNLRLLFPHTIMGYIIGKKGSRFREIEQSSASQLKASDQILPSSTDRILNITGVADAIHIATYYVAQTVIEHKQQLQKAVYYNPANFNQPSVPALSQGNNANNTARFDSFSSSSNNMMMPNMYGKMMNPQQMPFNGMLANGMNMSPQGMNMNMNIPGINMANPGMNMNMNMGQGVQQNNLGMNMIQGPVGLISPNAANNSRTGELITGPDGKINQEVYVSQNHIGLVIGRGGKNLKDIRQSTGCYVKVNDEIPGADERKLTLIGNVFGIQNAVVLINNKIENEKMRKQRDGLR